MPNYLFIAPAPRFYPEFVGPEGSLIALPGDVVEFETPPTDGQWVETDRPANDTSGRSWPLPSQPAETVAEATVAQPDPQQSLPFGPEQEIS